MKPCTKPVAAVTNRDVEAEVVEAVKFLWKRKRKQTRKRLILSGAGSGSKKFQRWGSESELGSIKLQEEMEAEALSIWLLPHPYFKHQAQYITYSKLITNNHFPKIFVIRNRNEEGFDSNNNGQQVESYFCRCKLVGAAPTAQSIKAILHLYNSLRKITSNYL